MDRCKVDVGQVKELVGSLILIKGLSCGFWMQIHMEHKEGCHPCTKISVSF
jgi:hypothetical protein